MQFLQYIRSFPRELSLTRLDSVIKQTSPSRLTWGRFLRNRCCDSASTTSRL